MKSVNYMLFTIVLALFGSCKKFVSIAPPENQLVGSSVFADNASAASAVTGIYETMVRNSIGGGINGVSALLGLSADEFKLYPNSNTLLNQTYTNSLLSTSNTSLLWNDFYNALYQANSAIEGLTNSTKISEGTRRQLLGESKFIRAFCHFYLTNIYGDVPVVTTTNYSNNQVLSRSAQTIVYRQIVDDLLQSQILLPEAYVTGTGIQADTRVRPNKFAAAALLSKVYLYEKKYDSAEIEASIVINNANYQLSSDLNTVFLGQNNQEAIWQLEAPNTGLNAADAAFLNGYTSPSGPSSVSPFSLSDSLVNSFETGDLRKTNWVVSKTIGSNLYYFPFKYKLNKYTGLPPVEYPVILRLAEIYLIRAEARLQQGNVNDGMLDLNRIRARAGLGGTTAVTQSDLLGAVMQERKVELFTEYGNRWFDLKRTGLVNSVMSYTTPLKGGTWETTDALYPIPLSNIQADPNLTQNPGY